MRVLAWIFALVFVAYAALIGWGTIASLRRLSRVPPGRQRVARFMVASSFAGAVLRILIAVTLLLATYDPSGAWMPPVVVALVISLIVMAPGLGMYLWHHHEPWIQEWRGSRPLVPRESSGAHGTQNN
jgi:hypothetical protein